METASAVEDGMMMLDEVGVDDDATAVDEAMLLLTAELTVEELPCETETLYEETVKTASDPIYPLVHLLPSFRVS